MAIYVNRLYQADLDINPEALDIEKDMKLRPDNPDDYQLLMVIEAFRRQWTVFWKNRLIQIMSPAQVNAIFAVAEGWEYVSPDLPQEEFSAQLLRQAEEVRPLVYRLIEVSTGLSIAEMPKTSLKEAEIAALNVIQKTSRVLGQWKQAAIYSDVCGGAVGGGIEVYCGTDGLRVESMPHERSESARRNWESYLARRSGKPTLS